MEGKVRERGYRKRRKANRFHRSTFAKNRVQNLLAEVGSAAEPSFAFVHYGRRKLLFDIRSFFSLCYPMTDYGLGAFYVKHQS